MEDPPKEKLPFKNDQEELTFYRAFHSKMNAAIYINEQTPFKVGWISKNECVKRVTGLNPKEVIEKGEFIHSWLIQSPDFEESVTIPIQKFRENPNIKWAGVYRISDKKGRLSWVMYSASTFEINAKGLPTKIAVVAFPLEDIFNTPQTLKEFQKYLSRKVNEDQINKLTPRQLEILVLIGRGNSFKEIAETLKISHHTVQDHKNALYKKLDCNSIVEIARTAEKFGLT